MGISECIPLSPQFDIDYADSLNIEVVLQDSPDQEPLSAQGITNVEWELTSGDSTILTATTDNVEIYGTSFTGKVTLTNDSGATTKTFFWPDPNNCYALTKVAEDKYQVIDRCQDNLIVNALPIKELYDIYGNKISDIPINSQDLDIENIGDSGAIHIIRVNVNGENVTKRIIKD